MTFAGSRSWQVVETVAIAEPRFRNGGLAGVVFPVMFLG